MILPNSPALEPNDHSAFLLPEMIAELLEKAQRVDALTQAVELKSEVIASLKQRIELLEEALRLSKIKRFAPSSEQSGQMSLFDDAEVEATVEFETATDEAVDEIEAIEAGVASETSEPSQPKQKPGRKPFAANLPRVQIAHHFFNDEGFQQIVHCGGSTVSIDIINILGPNASFFHSNFHGTRRAPAFRFHICKAIRVRR